MIGDRAVLQRIFWIKFYAEKIAFHRRLEKLVQITKNYTGAAQTQVSEYRP